MRFTREMRYAAGALAFIGAVAWMLPPTTPVAPIAGAGQYAVRAPGAAAIAAPADAAEQSPPPIVGGPQPVPVDYDAAAPRAAPPAWRDPPAEEADDADGTRPDPAFAMGYHWAQTNGIEERRDCRRWRGSAAEEGCRTALSDAEEAQDRAGDDPAPGG